MKQILFELFLQLTGVGSASGLVYDQGNLYLISDNSTFLYRYDLRQKQLDAIAIDAVPAANLGKPVKPDFEAIAINDGKLYAIGSGSTPKRQRMAVVNLRTNDFSMADLSTFYAKLKKTAQLSDDQFNLEGLVFAESGVLLFQRGNGSRLANGVFVADGLDADADVCYHRVELPAIDGVPSSFTDATLADGRLFVLASAEASNSTYLDGDVSGSLIAELDPTTFELKTHLVLPGTKKFEGIACAKQTGKKFSFYLCEDADSNVLQSEIHRLDVKF
ncbi:MAG TPA: hypothetical protein PLA69_05565 [Flavobacterium sp.]|nr:hypothetical protein [Flavobacterium sp.]